MTWADASSDWSSARCAPDHLADLVPRAAELWPDAPAVVGDNERLSWSEVEVRTRRLAQTLVAGGVRRGDRVAVVRLKSNESFEAVHAILRAGAAVVPIDPLAPPAPVCEILGDAQVTAIVGDAGTIEPLDAWSNIESLRCVVATGAPFDDRVVQWRRAVEEGADVELPALVADDVAYLIYTSGSTGRPKGIVHTHRSGLAYARTAAEVHGLRGDDRVAGMSPLHFDMSTLELYAAPYVGACVVTINDLLVRFPASFTERCEQERVTVWYTVPSILQQVVARGGLDRRDLGSVRWVGYGGEPYPVGELRRLISALPRAEVVNVYGPAEVNACTTHVVAELPDDVTEVPIGRPWPAAQVRVVDDDGVDVPTGVVGELLVAATTAMREYWRRPELTRQRLRPSPSGPSWYATGDLVFADDDGLLWFRGRIDHQVKVRGVRIELEGVEAVLTEAPGVAQAVVGPAGEEGDSSHLVAAVVPIEGAVLDAEQLRAWCAARLPTAAIPARIAIRSGFPTTQTGKVDRRRVRAELAHVVSPGGAREEHGVA